MAELSKVKSLWSDCAERTFLSSETQTQLYTRVHCVCVSACTRHDSRLCASFYFHTSVWRLVLETQLWVVVSLLWKGNIVVSVLCVFASTPLVSFPSTFLSPHLFLLLLDTALPIPLPPSLPYSLTLLHPQPHFPIPTVSSPPPPLLFSSLVPHVEVYHSPGHTSSPQHDKLRVGQSAQLRLRSATRCRLSVLKRL